MSSNTGNGRQRQETAESDVTIGKVVSVNIPKKQLRIAPETSHPERFEDLSEIRLRTKQGPEVLLAIDNIRITKSVVIANAGADADNDALASTRGARVVVKRSERFPLPDDEYYADDLVGIVVKDKEGSVIGRLSEVWETPANDIYQVIGEGDSEILLPAIEDVILSVDIDGGEMIADISNLI